MSLFGSGRPQGGVGGIAASQADRLDKENVRQDISTKQVARSQAQAEYFDYLDATEARQSERTLQIARDKADMEVIPSAKEKAIEQNVTDTMQAKEDRKVIPSRTQEELRQLHQSMTDQQYNEVTRAYHFFTDTVQSGGDVANAYDMARAEIIRISDNPQQAEQWLQSRGIGTEFSPDAVNALSALSSWGIHDSKTARAEHLLEVEWDRRIAVARAQASGDPEDMRTKYVNEEAQRSLGKMLQAYIKDFDDFEGGTDDKGNYTGDRGSIVATLAEWSVEAQTDQILGDTGVNPLTYQRIGADMLNIARANFSDSGLFFGTNNTGDDFNGAAFMNAADAAMSKLEVERARLQAHGVEKPIYEIWKAKGPQIMAQMEANHRQMQAEGSAPPPKPSQQSNAATTGSGAGTAAAANTTISTQPGSDVQALKTRKQVNDAIRALGEGKWDVVAGKRQKSAKFKELLARRKAVTAAANKKKAAFKAKTDQQRAESPVNNFSSIFNRN